MNDKLLSPVGTSSSLLCPIIFALVLCMHKATLLRPSLFLRAETSILRTSAHHFAHHFLQNGSFLRLNDKELSPVATSSSFLYPIIFALVLCIHKPTLLRPSLFLKAETSILRASAHHFAHHFGRNGFFFE